MNRGVWWGVYRVTELDMTEQLSRHTHTHILILRRYMWKNLGVRISN